MQGFKVSNFRLFDRNGVKVEFSPITILTGINSSGKSSFVKAMVLVGDFIESIRDAYKKDGTFDINAASLNFSRQELLLKGFKSSINRRSLDDFPYIRFAVDVNLGSYLGTYTVEYGFKEGMSAFGPDSAVIDTISIKSHEKEFFLAKANGNRLRVDTFNVSSCLLGSFWDTLLLCVLPADVIGKYSHPIDGLYSEFRSEDGLYENYDKLAETPEGIRLFEMQNTRYPDQLDKAVFHLRNIISMPGKDKLKTLFNTDLTDAVEKLCQKKLMFYFPLLEQFEGKTKEESLEILGNAQIVPLTMSKGFELGNGDGLIKKLNAVIEDYKESENESFIDYYRTLEDDMLCTFCREFFALTKVGEPKDFYKDEIEPGLDMSFDNLGFNRREGIFADAYDALSAWQWAEDEKSNPEWMETAMSEKYISNPYDKSSSYLHRSADIYLTQEYHSKHILYKAFLEFVEYILKAVMMPDVFSSFTYYNSSFTTVIKRLYSFEENSGMVRAVKDYLYNRSLINQYDYSLLRGRQEPYVPDTFMNKWLKEFGICDSVEIDNLEGLGFVLYAVKNNGSRESLADMGHGATQIISILLLIESAIMRDHLNMCSYMKDRFYNIESSPVIRPIIAIEEPEASMHPCMQSKLASMFEDVSRNYGNGIQFVIETHSEYLVRKSQAIVSGYEDLSKNPFSVYYFTADGDNYRLNYTEGGYFDQAFGSGFFDESSRSSFELMKKQQERENQ